MLISLNWLKKYVDIPVSDDELITLIGARLVEVEEVIDQTHKYDNIFAVKVVSCEKIPDTHLSLCKIDDGGAAQHKKLVRGDDGLIQVMCGAPNVHQGMMAAWIAPGATVPASVKEDAPFVIGVRKMLGQYDSYGMLAGADELDFGDDHSGIVELESSIKPGATLAELFDLNDLILDIENKSLTHRPDTFGLIGFAREVAGILGQSFTTPDWLQIAKADFTNDDDIKLDIEITDQSLCPRYTALVFNPHGEAKQHYLSLQDTLLARAGMRPIDPIVDATNYLMLLTGQPLHAFDYDKFVAVGGSQNPKIIVRAAKSGETLALLDGKTIELTADDIVITSNNIPVALAGAMGGANTEIDQNTRRVILESATFSLYNLRKTQMAHGIFSEAITRFTKGQPTSQTLPVALRFAQMVPQLKLAAVFDSQKSAPQPAIVSVSMAQLNGLLGTEFSATAAQQILQNVGFTVDVKQDVLHCTVPAWRTDIHIAEDLIEEVGRLSGFDNIAPNLPLHATAMPNKPLALKSKIRQTLSSFGANETLTYSFVHGDLLQKVGQDLTNSYKIVNSISPDLQYIRQHITPSLLDKAYANLRAGYDHFALFEMNQVYCRNYGLDEDGVPQNQHHLAYVLVDAQATSNFYTAKLALEQLCRNLGVAIEFTPFVAAKDHGNAYFEPLRSALVVADGQPLGYLGEVRAAVCRQFKLPVGVAAFEIDLQTLLAQSKPQSHVFKFSQYPFVSRDLTLTVPSATPYAKLDQQLRQAFEQAGLIYRLKATSIYQPESTDTKNVSFHLEFAHPDKTLAKAEIQGIMQKLEKIK